MAASSEPSPPPERISAARLACWLAPPQAASVPDRAARIRAAIAVAIVFAGKAAGALLLLAPWDLEASEWRFGYEAGHIAANLAAGHGFSIAVGPEHFIPTAWMSPAYPLLLAGMFRAFGAFSSEAAHAAVLANCLFQGLTAGLLFLLGVRWGGRRAGLVTVALFVVNPGGWQFLDWAWPTHLFALAILAHLHALARAPGDAARAGARCGATLGLALLVDGAAIALLPVTALSLALSARRGRTAPALLVAGLALALVLAPWGVRNQRVLGTANPLRGNVGVNLWLGNHPGARAESFHGIRLSPWHDRAEGQRMVELGETAYDRAARERALARFLERPGEFLANSAMRFSGFWLAEWWVGWGHIPAIYTLGHVALTALAAVGAWRSRRAGTGFLVVALLLFALPYALTVHGHGRYRVPVEPILCLLGALGIAGASPGGAATAPAGAAPPDRARR